VIGAFLNVKINAAGLKDNAFVADVLEQGYEMEKNARAMEEEILQIVHAKINI